MPAAAIDATSNHFDNQQSSIIIHQSNRKSRKQARIVNCSYHQSRSKQQSSIKSGKVRLTPGLCSRTLSSGAFGLLLRVWLRWRSPLPNGASGAHAALRQVIDEQLALASSGVAQHVLAPVAERDFRKSLAVAIHRLQVRLLHILRSAPATALPLPARQTAPSLETRIAARRRGACGTRRLRAARIANAAKLAPVDRGRPQRNR